MESDHLSNQVKQKPSKQLQNLNHFPARKTVDKKLQRIFSINNKFR